MARCRSSEFAMWRAFWTLEPPEGDRIAHMLAQVCRVVAGAFGGRETSVQDWLIRYEHDTAQTPGQAGDGLMQWLSGLGGD